MHAKTWTVDIHLFEEGDRTFARATLHTHEARELIVHASARRHPRDPEVPEIGDEVAAGRALSELANALLDEAARDSAGVVSV